MNTPTETTTRTGSPPTTPDSTTSKSAASWDDRTKLVAALVAVGAAALFLVAAIAVVQRRGDATGSDANAWRGTLVDPGLPRPDFSLTDTDGQPFDFGSDTEGQLTLLFFGYTHCPDICPVQMAILSAALDTPGMPEATVVFVTTDPARDDGERLREWLDQFDRQFVGLTGTPEQIAEAERAAQVAGSFVEESSGDAAGGDYTVGHAAQIMAYTPDNQAHVLYPAGVRREDWVNDLPRLLERWGAGSDLSAEGAP
jgi:protein SCO1/2